MPTVLRLGPYRFFFYSSDGNEPRHRHVQRDRSVVKFWLDPTRYEKNQGFQASEIRRIEDMIIGNHLRLTEAWMSTSANEIAPPTAVGVTITKDAIVVALSDGRTIAVPISWYPRLEHATQSERQQWELIGSGAGIHWLPIDEDISVEALLDGKRSSESDISLERWIHSRRF